MKNAWSPPPNQDRIHWLKKVILSDNSICHVATASEDALLGFSIFLQKERVIQAVYVDPTGSGAGIGARLVALTENAARRAEIFKIELKASLNAVAFYRRLQFVPLGKSEQKLSDGSAMPALAMEKQLKAAE